MRLRISSLPLTPVCGQQLTALFMLSAGWLVRDSEEPTTAGRSANNGQPHDLILINDIIVPKQHKCGTVAEICLVTVLYSLAIFGLKLV